MSPEDRTRLRQARPTEGANWKRTLYVPIADRGVWEAAQDLAEGRGISLSSVVSTALAQYLEREGKHGNST